MENTKEKLDDELRPEYDLEKLQLRRVGPGRKATDGPVVCLASDVAAVFPDSQAVNEALRFLIRIVRSGNVPVG